MEGNGRTLRIAGIPEGFACAVGGLWLDVMRLAVEVRRSGDGDEEGGGRTRFSLRQA